MHSANTRNGGRGTARSPSQWHRLHTLIVALALSLLACGVPDPMSQALAAAGTPDDVSLERALDATLRPAGPGAAEAFLAALPQPRSVRERTVTNAQNPRQRDTLRTLLFPGIAITVYHVSASGKRFPVAVKVTSARFRAPDGLRVGQHKGQVRAVLGAPTTTTDEAWRYRRRDPSGSAPFELRVRFHNGRVSALEWLAYLD